jgi:hypothetical protein
MFDRKISLTQFIAASEVLDLAFAEPQPAPDVLVHKCEMAEQALFGLIAERGSTADPILAHKFALTRR